MQLIVSRLAEPYYGMAVSLKDGDKIDTIAMINGNLPDFKGPVILTKIDQDILYGLSHREVVSRIYSTGPQILLTTKELAHKLFEHGMKASLGKIKIGNTPFTATIDTFYDQTMNYGRFEVEVHNGLLACRFRHHGYEPVLISNNELTESKNTRLKVEIDKIRTEVTTKLNPI